jgi:hypothetical protein
MPSITAVTDAANFGVVMVSGQNFDASGHPDTTLTLTVVTL